MPVVSTGEAEVGKLLQVQGQSEVGCIAEIQFQSKQKHNKQKGQLAMKVNFLSLKTVTVLTNNLRRWRQEN